MDGVWSLANDLIGGETHSLIGKCEEVEMIRMDILVVKRSNGIFLSYYNFSSNSFNISVSSKSFKTYCSTNNSQQPQRNGDDDDSAKDNKSGIISPFWFLFTVWFDGAFFMRNF